MSVLIKGMDGIPEDGAVLVVMHDNGKAYIKHACTYGYSMELVKLPETHGRLIDENNVIDAVHERLQVLRTHKEFIKKHGDIDLLGVLPYISKIQTVIEAEGEEC
jgi:hypothetical protein